MGSTNLSRGVKIFRRFFGEKVQVFGNGLLRTGMCSVAEVGGGSTIRATSLSNPHTPVMVEQVLEFLAPEAGHVMLDMTFGAGGHSKALLDAVPGLRMVCLDRDPTALTYAAQLQEQYPRRVLPLLGRFSDLPKLLTRLNISGGSFDGILMDLGASSMQFDTPARGFMLSKDGPLDMRMDGNRNPQSVKASDVIAQCDETELYKVLKYYGEEKHARKLARALIESRYLFRQLRTTKELADFVAEIIGSDTRIDKLKRFAHPATKTFQALRILVNNELNELDYAMQLANYYLRVKGVLAVIAFHSLEDTIIKRHITGVHIDQTPATIGLGLAKHRTGLSLHSREEMQKLIVPCWSPLTRHVILPSEDEIIYNPRARSAKLRAASKLEPT